MVTLAVTIMMMMTVMMKTITMSTFAFPKGML